MGVGRFCPLAETELAKLSYWFNLNFTLIKGLVETFSQPFA